VAATLGWDAQSGSFSYDANGNMTSSPAPYSVTGATYDHRNLPTALTSGSTTTAYRYDHAGQRTHKRVGSGNTEIYVLEGTVTLGVVTVDGSGAVVSSTFNVIADGQVIGRQETGGARLHYHRDLLGSTRVVTEGATVVESYDYDPWGVLMPGRALAGVTKEGFTTKERDGETGLDYFGARYYMAALGRWGAVDPLADNYSAWSAYNYVLNNPANHLDPDGREVRCRRREDCQTAAEELNTIHGGETGITVEEATWRQRRRGWRFWQTEEVSGYRLSTADSDFDWGQDEYTSALYDVINSRDISFDLAIVPEDYVLTDSWYNRHLGRQGYTAWNMMGMIYPRKGGARVLVGRSNRRGDPVGVVLMHELVGHGHPTGGTNANRVSNHYRPSVRDNHGGYRERIGWREWGLYQR
jgi:RHS repeat-associated protein